MSGDNEDRKAAFGRIEGGLRPGRVYVLGAGVGTGKSMFPGPAKAGKSVLVLQEPEDVLRIYNDALPHPKPMHVEDEFWTLWKVWTLWKDAKP